MSRPSKAAAPREAVAASGPMPSVGLLRVLSFFSGGSVMIVEFCGNRLLAPSFGSSLYTWTALIGVILVALSFGDYIGGQLVDRAPRLGLLPVLFCLGGILTALIPVIEPRLPDYSKMDLIMGPVVISLLLFFLPGLVLAAITPVSIRMLSMAQADTHIGRSAGTVGMAAALGSFTGTMGTTYLLIPLFGVRAILLMLGGLLLAIGLALGFLWRGERRGERRGVGTLVALALLGSGVLLWGSRPTPLGADVIFQKDTFYHRISVLNMRGAGGTTQRLLKLDSTFEGAQEVESGDLLFDYQKYWRLAEVLCPRIDHAVFLGAGAFGMPEKLSLRYPGADVDVVEVDPEVIDVGRRFFKLDEYPHVKARAADARRFLRTTPTRYDLVFGDAYNGVEYIPAHLVTREFFSEMKARLTERGVFIMNVIGAVQGRDGDLFWRISNSLRPSFAHLQVYAPSSDPLLRQNLIIVASDADIDSSVEAYLRSDAQGPIRALLDTRLELPPQQNRDLVHRRPRPGRVCRGPPAQGQLGGPHSFGISLSVRRTMTGVFVFTQSSASRKNFAGTFSTASPTVLAG